MPTPLDDLADTAELDLPGARGAALSHGRPADLAPDAGARERAVEVFDELLEQGSPPRWRVGAGAAIVLVLVAAAVAVAIAALRPSSAGILGGVDAGSGEAGAGGSALTVSSTPTSTEPATLFVHVLGAVRDPGVYELPPGSRLMDAVAAAGGLAEDADAGAVNLARTMEDGEQLRIPRIGEEPPPDAEATAATAAAGSAGASGPSATAGASGLVDLNTASQAELETLPRIGPAMAQRILDYREQHGGFRAVEELREVSGIGDATYEQLAPLVTV